MKKHLFSLIFLLFAVPEISAQVPPAYETINSAVCENGMCPPPQQNMNQRPNPAVVRIVVLHENSKSYGSGTFVRDEADHYFILTCAHLFEKTGPRKITVLFPDQSVYEVRLLALDRTWDLAILWDEIFLPALFPSSGGVAARQPRWSVVSPDSVSLHPLFPVCTPHVFYMTPETGIHENKAPAGVYFIQSPPPLMNTFPEERWNWTQEAPAEGGTFPVTRETRAAVPWSAGIPLGKTVPKSSDVLYYAGYGSTGQYLVRSGRLEGYCAVQNGGSAETLVISGTARQGDSGGPIVNASGELVGVLWGTDGRTVCGTYIGRIERFIQTAQNESGFFRPFSSAGNPENVALPQRSAEPVSVNPGAGKAGEKMTLDEIIAQLMTHHPEFVAQFMQGKTLPPMFDVNTSPESTYEDRQEKKGSLLPATVFPGIGGSVDDILGKLEDRLQTRMENFIQKSSSGLISSLLSTLVSALAYMLPPTVAVIYITRKIMQRLGK